MHLLAGEGSPGHLLQQLQCEHKLFGGVPQVKQLPQLVADWFIWLWAHFQLLEVLGQVAPGQAPGQFPGWLQHTPPEEMEADVGGMDALGPEVCSRTPSHHGQLCPHSLRQLHQPGHVLGQLLPEVVVHQSYPGVSKQELQDPFRLPADNGSLYQEQFPVLGQPVEAIEKEQAGLGVVGDECDQIGHSSLQGPNHRPGRSPHCQPPALSPSYKPPE
eukprot:11197008-Lingulodinium_polyedra.AAC.1